MKKRLLALFAACSMITTAVSGLIQTAYAADMSIRIEVSDVDGSDTQKVLTFYYDGVDTATMVEGKLSFDNADVTIDSAAVTIEYPAGMGDKAANTDTGYIMFTYYDDGGLSSSDKSFATATITVPGDVDVKATFTIEGMVDGEWNVYENVEPVEVTIPKNAPAITPAEVTAVEKQNADAINGTGEYETQTADIYGVEITPNDETVTGATVSVGGQTKPISFDGTKLSGTGTIVFAVILASESGAALPTLSADNVTPIVVSVD